MVVNAPLPPTGVKRPSSHDDYAGWETAPPMGAPMRPLNLPFHHYAMIYLDHMGKLNVTESASIQEQGSVFTPEVRQRFLEILGSKIGYHRPIYQRASGFKDVSPGYAYPHDGWSNVRHAKRRRSSGPTPDLHYGILEPVQEFAEPAADMVPLEIGDTEKVIAYYENAFKHFQQLNCRQVAKAFIKFIEPRKQVKHPYNGGRPSSNGTKGDPEKTKPGWWPVDVVHKEPDHLRKDQRLRLLIHIIRKLGKFGFTSDKLKEVAHDAKRSLKPQNKLEIMDEIFRVRRLEERYERGERDGDSIIYVVNRDTNPKQESDTVSDVDQKSDADDFEDDEDDLDPVTSTEQVSAPLPTPIDHMAMSAPRSMPMTSERSQAYSLPDPLSFEDQPKDRSFYSMGYPDDFSHNILKTPATSTMVNPNEAAAFDYLSQTPFPASTAEDHRHSGLPMQQSTSQYDAWTPSFRPTLFNPVDYNSSHQTIPQPPYYHMPVPASHPHDMSNGLPDLYRPKPNHLDPLDLKAPPLRTGSLGHPHLEPLHH